MSRKPWQRKPGPKRRELPRLKDGTEVIGVYSDDSAAYLLASEGQTPTSREGVRDLRRSRGIPAAYGGE